MGRSLQCTDRFSAGSPSAANGGGGLPSESPNFKAGVFSLEDCDWEAKKTEFIAPFKQTSSSPGTANRFGSWHRPPSAVAFKARVETSSSRAALPRSFCEFPLAQNRAGGEGFSSEPTNPCRGEECLSTSTGKRRRRLPSRGRLPLASMNAVKGAAFDARNAKS